jgi:PLP dependent protein
MTVCNQYALLKYQLQDWSGIVVAVTKGASLEQCEDAFNAGLTHFGENRVQSLQEKQAALAYLPIHWHVIGSLQQNKLPKLIGPKQLAPVSLIHSVDSLALANKVSQQAMLCGCPQAVLLQVNWVAEPQKRGFAPQALITELPSLFTLPGLSIQGLMWIAPQGAERQQLKQWFTGVAQFKDQLENSIQRALPELSMGMSQDFDIAVHCGATIIRVGSRLFA